MRYVEIFFFNGGFNPLLLVYLLFRVGAGIDLFENTTT